MNLRPLSELTIVPNEHPLFINYRLKSYAILNLDNIIMSIETGIYDGEAQDWLTTSRNHYGPNRKARSCVYEYQVGRSTGDHLNVLTTKDYEGNESEMPE